MTEIKGVNHELFVDVLAQIEKHPETWKQGSWRDTEAECGTAYCFAGHACQMNGVQWLSVHSTFVHPTFGVSASEEVDGVAVARVNEVAAALLGIPLTAAAELFWGYNTLDDLYRISADLMGIDETVLRDKVRTVVSA